MTIAQTLAVTGAATFSDTVQASGFKVGGIPVVGAQQGPISEATSSNKIARINDILQALRNHGLIAL